INMAFEVDGATRLRLMTFFVVALIIYVFGQRIVRKNLIKVTSNYLCDMRMNIINKLLNTYFSKMESIEPWKVLVVLNNDTEAISNFINTAISGFTGAVTLLFGMLYMGLINPFGLLIASVVSFAAAVCYIAAAISTNKIWERARDLQSLFIKYINDLLDGFKELKLNSAKRKDFHYDVEDCSGVYRDKRIEFDFKFANVYVIGELMFTVVVGVIAFLFPIIFGNISSNSLRSYIFIFFYLLGPLHGILAVVPNLVQVKASWQRVKSLTKEISDLETIPEQAAPVKGLPGEFTMELKDATFSYKGENGENFKIGPINLSFKSGEITFLTGGNGSGKSTLAKLITGLYSADEGEILINGEYIEPERLNELFAAVFSDYHMFEKLYGIDVVKRAGEIDEYLKKLKINHKLHINPDKTLSNIWLSTGQKKRVALMVSYLENRPIYLFDEWAADQDPQFRRYFYHTLLPELKAQGKCVIAVTHDDRYFETADKVIKLEYGKVVEEKINKAFTRVGEEVS
ncbi:MAG TPA: cyclic peptide export ABC transporter, partial [Clostridia bacterium]|nr:cyclic peptide export ABC transporter [Clostridia bacterium]